jgi:hypothetical protein
LTIVSSPAASDKPTDRVVGASHEQLWR